MLPECGEVRIFVKDIKRKNLGKEKNSILNCENNGYHSVQNVLSSSFLSNSIKPS